MHSHRPLAGFPVRINPHALALDLWGDNFDALVAAGDLSAYHRHVASIRENLGPDFIVHAEPDARHPGTFKLYDSLGRLSFESVPESTFVEVAA